MTKFGLYWTYYRSTLGINLGFSTTISLLIFPVFFKIFPYTFMTFGPILSILFKEVMRKNEYYFYYNKGISKIGLMASTFGLNIVLGIFFLIIFHYAKSFGN